MSKVIIEDFEPSATQIVNAAFAVASRPGSELVVLSRPATGSKVFGDAEYSGRRQKDYERGLGYLHELTERNTIINRVFLGGACGVPWRKEIAIPILDAAGFDYYNPEVDDFEVQDAKLKAAGVKGGIMEQEAMYKTSSYVLLFVFDSRTRAIATLNECVEFMMAARQKVVIVSALMDSGVVLGGQEVTAGEVLDINLARGRLFVEARNRGVPVFESVAEATKHCVKLMQEISQDYTVKKGA